MTGIHQLMAGAGGGDAITNYAFELQAAIREEGHESFIFAPEEHLPSEFKGERIRSLNEFEPALEKDILLYHYSIGSKAAEVYLKTKGPRFLCYHNITPEKYFAYSPYGKELKAGREALKDLTDTCAATISDSDFNRQELASIGFKNNEVLPIKFPRNYLQTEPDQNLMKKFEDGRTNLLFVGRVVPNKRFEDLVRVFYYYHKTVNPDSRLILAGSYTGNENYLNYLRMLINDLGLSGQVFFSGHIRLSELIACYQSAHAFLCLSEHEGFCLPLVEAMQFEVPIFALKRAAVPETMGHSGFLFNEMNPKAIAESIGYVLNTQSLSEKILQNQRLRLKEYSDLSLKEGLFLILKKYASLR